MTLAQFLAVRDDWIRRVRHSPEEWVDLFAGAAALDSTGKVQTPMTSDGKMTVAGSITEANSSTGLTYSQQIKDMTARARDPKFVAETTATADVYDYGAPVILDVALNSQPSGQIASTAIVQPLAGYQACALIEEVYTGLGSSGSPDFYFGASAGLLTNGITGGVHTTLASFKSFQPNPFGTFGLVFRAANDADALEVAGGSFASTDVTMRIKGKYWYET